jgi:hypothetical protein
MFEHIHSFKILAMGNLVACLFKTWRTTPNAGSRHDREFASIETVLVFSEWGLLLQNEPAFA